jgi:hypothetical protein
LLKCAGKEAVDDGQTGEVTEMETPGTGIEAPAGGGAAMSAGYVEPAAAMEQEMPHHLRMLKTYPLRGRMRLDRRRLLPMLKYRRCDVGCACLVIASLRLFCNFDNLYFETFKFDLRRHHKSTGLRRLRNQFLDLAVFLLKTLCLSHQATPMKTCMTSSDSRGSEWFED